MVICVSASLSFFFVHISQDYSKMARDRADVMGNDPSNSAESVDDENSRDDVGAADYDASQRSSLTEDEPSGDEGEFLTVFEDENAAQDSSGDTEDVLEMASFNNKGVKGEQSVEKKQSKKISSKHLLPSTALSPTEPVKTLPPYLVKKFPNAMIIGALRSGTTPLARFLDLHPDTVVQQKAVNFFMDEEHYEFGFKWYQNKMPLATPEQVVIQKSPSYLQGNKTVAMRLHAFDRTLKFLVILTDPVQRLISHYSRLLEPTIKRSKTLREYVINEYSEKIDAKSQLIRLSMYHDCIKDWLKYYPSDQFLFISGEDFIKTPVDELYKIEKFLGVRHFFKKDHFIYNASTGFYCADIKDNHFCIGNGKPHLEIRDSLVARLINFFSPLNQKLYQLIGKSFEWPTKLQAWKAHRMARRNNL